MARIKPENDPTSPSKVAKPSAAKTTKAAKKLEAAAEVRYAFLRRRVKAFAFLMAVGAAALVVRTVWERVEPTVVARERYLLPAAAIEATAPPEWIVADVRSQVIERSGLDKRLSILDDAFIPTIKGAFELHPWVEKVMCVEKRFPPAVSLEIVYRRPVAVVEQTASGGVTLLPVDASGVALPADDVPLIRRKYLPRITGIVGQPRVGQRWDDPRVAGAVLLADRLADVWDTIHLAEIIPSARPEVRGDRRFFVYDLVTQGGTRIVWGPAPEAGAPDEIDFTMKRQRLEQASRDYGPFDTIESPDIINLRGDVINVTPRQAKHAAVRQAYVDSHAQPGDASVVK